jgi:hypothetical protein
MLPKIIKQKIALALVDKSAALYVKDSEAENKLVDIAIETIHQDSVLKDLSMNIKKLAFTNSASVIAEEVVKLANEYRKNHGN